MLDEVETAINDAPLGADVKLRLQLCLAQLAEVFADCGRLDAAFVIAASTPRTAVIFAADARPAPDSYVIYDRGIIALALHQATESRSARCCWVAARGRKPIVVVLSEMTDALVSVVVTVAEVEAQRPRTLH
jgi:hypothetical protein